MPIDFDSNIPFTKEEIKTLIASGHRTPFHVYDAAGIRDTARKLNQAFSWVPKINGKGFQNFFAVKALPNPYILKMLAEQGMGADCSSNPELTIAHEVDLAGEDIMFTSNDTPEEEYVHAQELSGIINLDDKGNIGRLEKSLHAAEMLFPELISFRYNPGNKIKGNRFIGDPTKAKYGVPDEQIVEAYREAIIKGSERFGLHTMMVSNEKSAQALIEQSRILFNTAARIHKETGIEFDFINLGGGIGIPYRPEDSQVDFNEFAEGVRQAYEGILLKSRMQPPRIVTESGRAITGPHGWLVTKVRQVADKYRVIVGVDSCMANLMRPGMYSEDLDSEGECYHHVTVLGKEHAPKTQIYDVAGSLCESCDVFARQRPLPEIQEGDLLAIHNTGAHGHAMGFNYNGKLRSAEFLMTGETLQMIRRAETEQDYFATLGFPNSRFSNLAKRR